MKTLAFLLLLDFSGSMDQPFQGRTKIEILKEETNAVLSTAEEGSATKALIFGTSPDKGCLDVRKLDAKSAEFGKILTQLRPGNQGKTPLALGLKEMVRASLETNALSSLVLTDGADSCGQDPCKVLESENKLLARANKRLKIHIIGFDLKGDNQKFKCFKDLKLSNIAVSMSEAMDGSDLQNKIRESQLDLIQEGASLKDSDVSRIKGLKKNSVSAKAPGAQDKSKKNEKKFDEEKEALIEILGAPSSAYFSAQGKQGVKSWQGSYVMKVAAGAYKIKFDGTGGPEVTLELGAGTHTKIPWARLLKNANAAVSMKSMGLTLLWKPSEETKLIHGEVQEFKSVAHLNQTDILPQDIPFGDWVVEVVSPPWLKGVLGERKIHLNYDTTISLNVEQLFSDKIKWLQNPKGQSLQVLRLVHPERGEERHLLQSEVGRVPVAKDVQAFWLHP